MLRTKTNPQNSKKSDMQKRTTAVLISGGVDSSVALHLLSRDPSRDLHLYYIRIGMDDGRGDCAAEEDIELCRLIASRYSLPFDIVPLHEEYWDHVMAYTLQKVKEGQTPHPDLMCNNIIKFGFFEKRVGCNYDSTATGHYACKVVVEGREFLATTPDPVKDQTDFLSGLTYGQLTHAEFPLGDIDKTQVRRIAAEAGLPNATRKDSQGICFLGKINYADFIARHLGEKTGDVVDIETGAKIGNHRGYWLYTIGQRKGLGLSGGPWFVVRKDTVRNIIYVANGYGTPLQYGRTLHLAPVHWISGNPFVERDLFSQIAPVSRSGSESVMEICFKNRHTPEFTKGELIISEDTSAGTVTARIESTEDIQGIAPGQYATIYTSDRRICLGSGEIT